MIELFKKIAEVQPKLPGWCPPEKAQVLASLVIAFRPAVTVEIGIFGGSSFIPMAMAHKEVGGIAIGIEPWDKKAAIEAQDSAVNRAWWDAQDLEAIYHNFMHNLETLGLNDHVEIHRRTSDQAGVPNAIGILHVDGGHNDQAVRDTARFAPHVLVGGFVVLDDLNWTGGAVGRAEQRLIQMGFRKLYPLGTGAVYQRCR